MSAFSLRWHGRAGQICHLRDVGKGEADSVLTMLAKERNVLASTHEQAFGLLLFLYCEAPEGVTPLVCWMR